MEQKEWVGEDFHEQGGPSLAQLDMQQMDANYS